jgi:hypothetical protein
MSRVSRRGLARIDLATASDDALIQGRGPHGRLNLGDLLLGNKREASAEAIGLLPRCTSATPLPTISQARP